MNDDYRPVSRGEVDIQEEDDDGEEQGDKERHPTGGEEETLRSSSCPAPLLIQSPAPAPSPAPCSYSPENVQQSSDHSSQSSYNNLHMGFDLVD